MCKKGKLSLLAKFLPGTKSIQSPYTIDFSNHINQVLDDIPHPPPPPYSSKEDNNSWNHMSRTQYPPMSIGALANHLPTDANSAKEGFNVWYIQGATGFVGMPPNNDATETLGRLETMKMVMDRRHDYDIFKIPRPPTPSDEDRAKAKEGAQKAKAKAKDNSDDSGDDAPPVPKKSKSLVCGVCKGKKSKETKKIKGEGTICWPCLWYRHTDKAEEKWLEEE